MKNLDKRYRRNIRYSLSFYICSSILTALCVLVVNVMYTSVDALDTTFSTIMKDGHVEDAQFTTLVPMPETERTELEDTYGVSLETIRFADLKEDDYDLRVFLETEKINIVQITDGSAISGPGEILLNPDFAAAHDIEPGDDFAVAGTEYRVAGTAVRPDYLYAQRNPSDFYVDDLGFGQVTMSPEDFEDVPNAQIYYAVEYSEDNSIAFRKEVHQSYVTLSYLSDEANNRIVNCRDIGKEYGLMLAALLPVLFGMNTLIVAVVLGRKIKREQRQIGTLLSFGYRSTEIIQHYLWYAIIPGITGSVTGTILSTVFSRPLTDLIATDFETPNYIVRPHLPSLLVCLIVPTLLYVLTTIVAVKRLVRKPITILLAGSSAEAKKRGRILAGSGMSFRSKFKIRSLISHKSRTIVVVLGLFFSSFLCSIGFVFADSWKDIITDGLDAAGTYEYQYYMNTLSADAKGGEKVLTAAFESGDDHSIFVLSGLQEDPKYYKLETKSGAPVEYGKYYMTTNAAELFGIKAGDPFTFINPATAHFYTVEIHDLIRDNTQCAVYTSLREAETLFGLPEGSYNLILSDRALDLDKNLVLEERSKEMIKEQLEFGVEILMSMIYMIIASGVLLCVVTVYLTVNMLVEENRPNISMLKVLGYKTKEINRILLYTNNILVPVCLAAGIVACLGLSALLFRSFIDVFNLYIEPSVTSLSILIIGAIQVGGYLLALTLLKRKAYRVDMVESLKDTRE
ncbi:MAG: FtsX-like permease family protein [Oscillospiraceae bacterium]|jgi:putative ABC transport system permease protein|nr:FtsX-like permease family protein [Oscillospiraceae bacterium]